MTSNAPAAGIYRRRAEPIAVPIQAELRFRVCVVGAGTRFLSGISYYTIQLANALAHSLQTSVITMDRLLPRRLYPGRARVGAPLTRLRFDEAVRVLPGVDWYWGPGIIRTLRRLRDERPDFVLLQWWSGTVLHTYLLLSLAARRRGSRLVVEFHEVLDTGESRSRLARVYARLMGGLVVRLARGFVVHSEFDRELLGRAYRLGERPVAVIAHGPFDQYNRGAHENGPRPVARDVCNLLYFGVIRPFKGVEDLVRAFDLIPDEEISGFWLTVVGETWEGWTRPRELIASSRHRDRITFADRYVDDEEAGNFLNGADVMVLPYHRSSTSGPLHVAMSRGLPVVVTRVGGLPEAVRGYEGAILVPPRDPESLRAALKSASGLRGRRFADPHSWQRSLAGYERLFAALA